MVKARVQRHPGDYIRKLFLAFLVAAAVEYLRLPKELRGLSDLAGLAQMSLGRVVGITCGVALLLWGVACFVCTKRYERWGIAAAFALLGFLALSSSFTWAFLLVCLAVLAVFVLFGLKGWDLSPEPIQKTSQTHIAWPWITAGLCAAFFIFVSVWTVCQVTTFSMPSFDFGLFAQMFHYMEKTGLPLTTLERDGLLSHFAVHVSPIYYLMLPFYMLVPRPETLQVLQAAVVASAAIPLWKIGGQRGLSGQQRTLLCLVLLLYPALSGGTSYGIHENCFLTPLILWLFYAIDRKNWGLTALFGVLTLLVKEDAPVYVAVIGLYLGVKGLLKGEKDELLAGGGMLAVAVLYFLGVTGYLASSGDGVMTYRYENFMYDGSASLFTVIKAVILSPMKAVFECVDKEKLKFIAQTMLPLLGLPLLTRRYERYFLLIPYVLVNLMSDYQYQHDVFFQYTFGSTAFLLYLAAVNLADMKLEWQRLGALTGAAMVAVACFTAVIWPSAEQYPKLARDYRGYYQEIRDALDTIPEDASVTAGTFLTTYISQRDVLYDIRYCTREHLLSTEYVVVKESTTGDFKQYATGKYPSGLDGLDALLTENGYVQEGTHGSGIRIYRRLGQG